MKYSNFLRILFVFVLLTFAANFALAQKEETTKAKLPNEEFGLGVSVGGIAGMGGTVVYAIQPQFHLGAYIGFSYDGGTKNTTSTTYMLFAPYGKYFFMEPIRYFRPFVIGQFLVQTASERYKDSYGIDQTRTNTSTGIAGSIGAEWFPYSSVGVYGGFKVLEFQIDPSRIIVGLGSSFVGIEWFL